MIERDMIYSPALSAPMLSFKTVQLFSGFFFSIKVCPNSCENGYVMQILKMDIQEQNEEFEYERLLKSSC